MTFQVKLSSEFGTTRLPNLYENPVTRKSNDKTGGYVNISLLSQGEERVQKRLREGLDKTGFFMF
jgi:hypothetical protein